MFAAPCMVATSLDYRIAQVQGTKANPVNKTKSGG
jgi:hypothetical protein